MAEPRRVVILSPTDIKPGSIAPNGKKVKSVRLYPDHPKVIVVYCVFEDDSSDSFMWPSASGWTVDGRTVP